MAGSRLKHLGTIFSRTTGLIRGGALAPEDVPIWYDVYHAHPPAKKPIMDIKPSTKPINNILYAEDQLRKLFYEVFGREEAGLLSLADDHQKPLCERFVAAAIRLATKETRTWSDTNEFIVAAMKEAWSDAERDQLRFGEDAKAQQISAATHEEYEPDTHKPIQESAPESISLFDLAKLGEPQPTTPAADKLKSVLHHDIFAKPESTEAVTDKPKDIIDTSVETADETKTDLEFLTDKSKLGEKEGTETESGASLGVGHFANLVSGHVERSEDVGRRQEILRQEGKSSDVLGRPIYDKKLSKTAEITKTFAKKEIEHEAIKTPSVDELLVKDRTKPASVLLRALLRNK